MPEQPPRKEGLQIKDPGRIKRGKGGTVVSCCCCCYCFCLF